MLTELDTYRALLQDHDWYYEYSDDHGSYTNGHEEKTAIRILQLKVDEDFSIWNEYAPEDFKRNKQ